MGSHGNGLGTDLRIEEGIQPCGTSVGVDLPRDKRMEIALTYLRHRPYPLRGDPRRHRYRPGSAQQRTSPTIS